MTRIDWGVPGSRPYDVGLDRGVFYSVAGVGVPWVGLVSVTENVSGGEVESYYYDGVKYLDVILAEDFQATLEAFNTPPEFAVSEGMSQMAMGLFVTQQPRVPFGMCYRTGVGDDLNEDAGYKLHLIYNLMAAPAEKSNQTRSSDNQLSPKSYTIYGRPDKPGTWGGVTYKPTAHLIVDSRAGNPHLGQLETGLYGPEVGAEVARLPSQEEVVHMLNAGFWS